MKKFLPILITVMLVCGFVYAGDVAETSGERTASGLVYNGPCRLTAVEVITDGTNDAKLIIYDSRSAANRVVLEMTIVGAANFGGRYWITPIQLNSGIYCAITGTGASYVVEYMRGAR